MPGERIMPERTENSFLVSVSLQRYNRRMERILYHGSEKIIEIPEYGIGSRRNDYGRGFYCTENKELAKEWACGRQRDGFVNAYRLQENGLQTLYLNQKPYTILHWLALLAENRTYWQKGSIAERAKTYLKENFLIDTAGYDLIVWYRADDSYFTFAQEFVSGVISLKKLKEAMMPGKLGEQVVLRSENAFQAIRFTGVEEASADLYYARKAERDRKAREAYRAVRSGEDRIDDIFMLDILREEMQPDDPRLQ